ncbi:MAG: hypothetical protein WKF59_26005 [Chitinophagaceae bacterium]
MLWKQLLNYKTGDKVLLLVAFKQHHNRDIKEELNILMQKGFSRIYVDKQILRIEDIQETKRF